MEDKILKAFLSVNNSGHPRANENWKILFDFYNQMLPPGERKLGMSCLPCFKKVYDFCKYWLLQQVTYRVTAQQQQEMKRFATDAKGMEQLAQSIKETGNDFSKIADAANAIK